MGAPENAFEQGIEQGEDDPFAGADLEFEQGQDPLSEPTTPEAALPIVNAEGERVDTAEAGAVADAQRTEAELDAGLDAAVAADQPPAEKPAEEAKPAEDAKPAGDTGVTEGQDAPAESEPDPTEAQAQDSPGTTPSETGGGEDPTEAAAPTDGETTAPSAEPSSEAETPAESPPAEVKDSKGAVTHRPYVLLTPTGDGVWREVVWYVDKEGNMVKKGTSGAKKQKYALCRGQDDALAIGYHALDAPDGGVKLVAVAATYFQPRHVEPEPIQPKRTRLKIR